MERRAMLAGLGLATAGVGLVASSGKAHADPGEVASEPSVIACTISELRKLTDPQLDHRYLITDIGQEGIFRYDPEDTTSEDNTGLVLVGASGHRFRRVFQGPIMLDWFGARPDYDHVAGTGESSDDALRLAFAALEDLAGLNQAGHVAWGMPTIMLSAGSYLFTQPGHKSDWVRTLQGLHIAGQGIHQTKVFLDIPESGHGSDNHFLINDGRAESTGGVMGYWMDGLSFHSVNGTERFMLFADGRGANPVVTRMHFRDVSWVNLLVGLDIRGNVNTSQIRMERCWFRDTSSEQVFILADNPQAQNLEFEQCEYWNYGTMFRFKGGGNLHVNGGQAYTFTDESCFLHIEGDGLGINNANFNITELNPEIRSGPLLKLNEPEAHVSFVNCRLSTPFANEVRNSWKNEEAYSSGTRVTCGYDEVALTSKQQVFECIQDHTSTTASRPRTGQDWRDYWIARYELEVERGHVEIRGGRLAANIKLSYGADSIDPTKRPSLKISDNCQLINPVADLVGFEPTDDVGVASARLPHVVATGCRPISGRFPEAYGVTPDEVVDVALNHHWGHEGMVAPLNHLVFRASGEPGEGLPSADDGENEFLVPRGAHVVTARIVSTGQVNPRDYRVTNHDGSVTLLPTRPTSLQQFEQWLPVTTSQERRFIVTSTADERRDGFVVLDYY